VILEGLSGFIVKNDDNEPADAEVKVTNLLTNFNEKTDLRR
jgi:hypothetical protein